MDATYEFKKILLPTDFSESAFMAMQHAARLASVCKGKLTLLNIREAFSESVLQKEFGIILKSDKDYIDHVNKLLKDKADGIKATFGIEVECISKSGNLKRSGRFCKKQRHKPCGVGNAWLERSRQLFHGWKCL